MDIQAIKHKLQIKNEELTDRKKRLMLEDPFGDPDRLENNAAIDADAAEQFGHETVSAMVEEIDRKLVEIAKALSRLDKGVYGTCAGCGTIIEDGRLEIEPAAELCVSCEQHKTVVDVM